MNKHEKAELDKLVEMMSGMLSSSSLHQVLRALSKGCMARCREMLNADTPKDTNGNTLRALLDFSERIDRLANSAQSHNPDAPKVGRASWSREKKTRAYGTHDDRAYREAVKREYAKGKSVDDDSDED